MTKPLPEPRPISLLRDIERRYSHIWDIASHVRNDKGNPEMGIQDWSEWCYLPLSAWFGIVEQTRGKDRSAVMSFALDAVPAAAIGTWRLGKGIYRFDPELYAELIDTPIVDDMPVEIFLRLPEYCIYIETPGIFLKGDPVHGFYAFLEEDSRDGSVELRLLYDCGRGTYPLTLALPSGWGFRAAFNKIYLNESVVENALESGFRAGATRDDFILEARSLRDFSAKTLPLLLYLCSDEPDFGDRTPPTRVAPRKIKGVDKWFASPGVNNWDVGVRIGATIRKHRQQVAEREPSESVGGRAAVRPHMRRAHWHGFWTGKRSEPLKRKFTLRWIPPTPVRMHDEDAPAVIRTVKK